MSLNRKFKYKILTINCPYGDGIGISPPIPTRESLKSRLGVEKAADDVADDVAAKRMKT